MQPDGRIDIRGIFFDNFSFDEAVSAICRRLSAGGDCLSVCTPNSEITQLCVESAELRGVINSFDITVADGVGVIYASKILKTPLREKIAGVELGEALLRFCAEAGLGVYFFGGKPGVARAAAEKMCEKHKGLDVRGVHDGYSDRENDAKIVAEINQSGASLLFVCLGAPAQEKWIYENKSSLSVSCAAGLGGSLDIYSGKVRRAPKIFIKLGLEWFWRLLREPKRIGRMMKLPKFLTGTWKYKNETSKNKCGKNT